MYRRLISLGWLVLSLSAATATVLAHMKATKFEPAAESTVSAAPQRVQVWFTEPPDSKVSKLELIGPPGAIKLGGLQATEDKSIVATIDDALPNGRYTARWQSAGNDGHVQKGEFAFTVQRAH